MEDVKLPKWPQMRVHGYPVTKEQALEIIRRTDNFFVYGFGGNDEKYAGMVRSAIGMPQEPKWHERERWDQFRDEMEKWREEWGVVGTEYVNNEWVSSCFVYGPHGWCRPDGEIHHHYNVGKWPSCDDILSDWTMIAEAFPFLDLGVTLMSGEHCDAPDTEPLVSFIVKNGRASSTEPDVIDHYPIPDVNLPSDEEYLIGLHRDPNKEKGIPWDAIEAWAKKKG